jgi:hypothetical protein
MGRNWGPVSSGELFFFSVLYSIQISPGALGLLHGGKEAYTCRLVPRLTCDAVPQAVSSVPPSTCK